MAAVRAGVLVFVTVLSLVLAGCGLADTGKADPAVLLKALVAGDGAIVTGAFGSLSAPSSAHADDGAENATWARMAGNTAIGEVVAGVVASSHADVVADKLGVEKRRLRAELGGLHAVQNRKDIVVTSHMLDGDRLVERVAVLQAGTPLLIDDNGRPRLRLTSGTPLDEVPAGTKIEKTVGETWEGFDHSSVVKPEVKDGTIELYDDTQNKTSLITPTACGPARHGGMCRTVATVDLDGDGRVEAVAVEIGSAPSIALQIAHNGTIRTYSPDINARPHLLMLGPDFIDGKRTSMAERLDNFFRGAFDVTGDGLPELVILAGTDVEAHYFTVVQLRDGRLVELPTPNEGMFSRGEIWGAPLAFAETSYRCVATGGANLELVGRQSGERQGVAPMRFDGREWQQAGGHREEPYQRAANPRAPKQWECEDFARPIPRAPGDRTEPYSTRTAATTRPSASSQITTRPPASPTPRIDRCDLTTDKKEYASGNQVRGFECDEMRRVWSGVRPRIGDPAYGNGQIIPWEDARGYCAAGRLGQSHYFRCQDNGGAREFFVDKTP